MKPMHVSGVLLAAGKARRFGADKLLARLPDGTPIAVAALRNLRTAVDNVIAVVHPRAAVAQLLAAEGAHVAVAAEAERGIGASIATGIRALDASLPDSSRLNGSNDALPRCDACLIALADMPFVREGTAMQLAQALRAGASLVAPEYRGTRGHPVGFSRIWFDQLSALQSVHGAQDILAVHRDALLRLPVDDEGVLTDIDRPADLEAFTTARS